MLIDPVPSGVEKILDILQQAGIRTNRQPPVVELGPVRVIQLLYEPKHAFDGFPDRPAMGGVCVHSHFAWEVEENILLPHAARFG